MNDLDAFLFIGPLSIIAGLGSMALPLGQGLIFWGMALLFLWYIDWRTGK